jgi:hypothetical protein
MQTRPMQTRRIAALVTVVCGVMLAGWLFGRHGTAAQSQDVPVAVVSAEHARGSAD